MRHEVRFTRICGGLFIGAGLACIAMPPFDPVSGCFLIAIGLIVLLM